MQKQTRCTLHLIAAVTVSVSAIALAPASHAAPADTCLKAPGGVAPQGKHWYYRTERPSMRKCWYLAEKGLTVTQRAAARTAPQDEPDEEADTPATVASVPAAPAAKVPAASAENVAPAPSASVAPAPAAEPPAPVITTLTTRNVSNEIPAAGYRRRAAIVGDELSAQPGPDRRSSSGRSREHACRAHVRQ